MNESYISSHHVAAFATWTLVVVLMTAAWVLLLVDPTGTQARFGFMCGFTATTVAAFASVLHVRTYVVRIMGLIRAVHAYDGNHGDGGGVRQQDGPTMRAI